MARERKERAHGPYEHGQRWRVVIVGATGSRRAESFETEREALAFVAVVRGQTSTRTVQGAVDAYLQSLRDRGNRPATVTRNEFHLRAMLNLVKLGARPLRLVTPKLAAERYAAVMAATEARKGHATDTHRNALAVAKSWGRFCASKGWLKADPFAELKGIGRRKKGKPQPRVMEARALFARCIRAAEDGDESAIALATVLLLGTRSSEVAERDVRDLDDHGRLLWIPDSKTDTGRRTLIVPAIVRPYLLKLAKGRDPYAPLFRKAGGDRGDRHWMHHHAERLAGEAGLTAKVTPQALRGLHGTLAKLAGSTSELVAKQLGHASTDITHAAYITREAAESAQRSAALEALGLGTSDLVRVPSDGSESAN